MQTTPDAYLLDPHSMPFTSTSSSTTRTRQRAVDLNGSSSHHNPHVTGNRNTRRVGGGDDVMIEETASLRHYRQQRPVQRPRTNTHRSSRSLSSDIHRFGRHTSMHGLPNVIHAKSTSARVIWCLVCLSAACMFGLQLTQLLRRYFSFPRKVYDYFLFLILFRNCRLHVS